MSYPPQGVGPARPAAAASIASGTSFPPAPSAGDCFYRTDLKEFYIYDGANWVRWEIETHASEHEPGGADEIRDINILGTGVNLSAHRARHQAGGADDLESLLRLSNLAERSHDSLTGVTPDQHHPQLHAASHASGGADEITSPLPLAAIPVLPSAKFVPAAATAPTDPAVGQLWYDTTAEALKVCKSSGGSDEQPESNQYSSLYGGGNTRMGQYKVLSNKYVSKLGFWLHKYGSPTGDVTFTIRRVSDDSIIASKVWGDASALSTEKSYEEVTFDTPVLVNEAVRLCVEFSGGGPLNEVCVWSQKTDVKAGEYRTIYKPGWVDFTGEDTAYKVTWDPQWAIV